MTIENMPTDELIRRLADFNTAYMFDQVNNNPDHAFIGPSLFELAINQLSQMKFEIEILRRYGNKDCIAMAEAALALAATGGKDE